MFMHVCTCTRCIDAALCVAQVLRLLIHAGYKSSRVLKELQLEGAPNPHMVPQMLKAKYEPSLACTLSLLTSCAVTRKLISSIVGQFVYH